GRLDQRRDVEPEAGPDLDVVVGRRAPHQVADLVAGGQRQDLGDVVVAGDVLLDDVDLGVLLLDDLDRRLRLGALGVGPGVHARGGLAGRGAGRLGRGRGGRRAGGGRLGRGAGGGGSRRAGGGGSRRGRDGGSRRAGGGGLRPGALRPWHLGWLW